jgi:CRP-like cAMP-binding protein
MTAPKSLEMVDVFADLNREQLTKIFLICHEEQYQPGDLIFEEGSPSNDIYVILDGKVEILVNASQSQESFEHQELRRITTLERGQSFGEIALVDEGLRSASARCSSEPCRLLIIKRDDLMALMRSNLDIGFTVMTNLAADLCLKIRHTNFLAREQLLYKPSGQAEK